MFLRLECSQVKDLGIVLGICWQCFMSDKKTVASFRIPVDPAWSPPLMMSFSVLLHCPILVAASVPPLDIVSSSHSLATALGLSCT